MPISVLDTTLAFRDLVSRQGGGLHFSEDAYYPIESSEYLTQVRNPDGAKPFKISVYNAKEDTEELSLVLLINPNDIQIGQVFVVGNTYTRKGWLPTLWGNQQSTITSAGFTAAFIYDSGQASLTDQGYKEIHEGIVNYYRKESIGFINFLTLVAIFKNNAYYHLNAKENETYFRDGTSRVISVIDQIKISYDGSEYLGSFTSFTLDEKGDAPFNLEYNFEFVVSGLRGDKVEGHVRQGDNYLNTDTNISIQGQDMGFLRTVRMDEDELNKHYKTGQIKEYEPLSYDYTLIEFEDEFNYYNPDGTPAGFYDTPEGRASVAKVDPNTVRVTRGAKDGEGHDGKIDYRTSSGRCVSLTDGVIFAKKWNYIVVKTQIEHEGKMTDAYIRYYHLDQSSKTQLEEGASITAGTLLGYEGTDNGKYPPHIDLEVKIFSGLNNSYKEAARIDAVDIFEEGVQTLKNKGDTDYQNTQYKHGEKKRV